MITEAKATKLLNIIDAGLTSGIGKPIKGECCILAAKRLAFGLPHGDSVDGLPVGTAVRMLDIPLNDCPWTSPTARAKGMRRLAIAELGSDSLDQGEFSRLLALRVAQWLLPNAIRAYVPDCLKKYHAEMLEIADGFEAAKTSADVDTRFARFDSLDSLASLASLARLARLASLARFARFASLASLASLDRFDSLDRLDRFDSLARLASPARFASLDRLARFARFDSLYRDAFFTSIADVTVSVLQEMKCPGCELLYLCDEPKPIIGEGGQ